MGIVGPGVAVNVCVPEVCRIKEASTLDTAGARLTADQSFSDHFWIARISRISKHYATYLLLMSLFTSASASNAFLRASRFRRAPLYPSTPHR